MLYSFCVRVCPLSPHINFLANFIISLETFLSKNGQSYQKQLIKPRFRSFGDLFRPSADDDSQKILSVSNSRYFALFIYYGDSSDIIVKNHLNCTPEGIAF